MFAVVGFIPFTGISSYGRYVEVPPNATYSISILDTRDGVVEDYDQDSLGELYSKCPDLKVFGVHSENGKVKMIYVPREYFFKSSPSKQYHVLLEQITDRGGRAYITIFDREQVIMQYKTEGRTGKDWYLHAVREYNGLLHILLKVGYGSDESFHALEFMQVGEQFKLLQKSLLSRLSGAFAWYERLKESGTVSDYSNREMEQQLLNLTKEAPIGTEFSLRAVMRTSLGQERDVNRRGIIINEKHQILVLASNDFNLKIGNIYRDRDFVRSVAYAMMASVRYELYSTQRDINEFYRLQILGAQ